MSNECLAFQQCGFYPKNYWLEWFGNQIWNTQLDSNRIAMHEWLDLVTWQWPILYTLQEKSHVSVVGVICICIYMCMYVYLYIYMYTRYRFGYLPVQGLLTDCCVPKQLFTEINLQADMLVKKKTWATPYSWAARDGCLPMLIGSAPVFPHGNPILGCWKLQNNHVRLVKIGLGRELVNPIYHHRNLLLFWGI